MKFLGAKYKYLNKKKREVIPSNGNKTALSKVNENSIKSNEIGRKKWKSSVGDKRKETDVTRPIKNPDQII